VEKSLQGSSSPAGNGRQQLGGDLLLGRVDSFFGRGMDLVGCDNSSTVAAGSAAGVS
jgi:hypothetical protein